MASAVTKWQISAQASPYDRLCRQAHAAVWCISCMNSLEQVQKISVNGARARFVFLATKARPAPLVVVIAWDTEVCEKLPHYTGA